MSNAKKKEMLNVKVSVSKGKLRLEADLNDYLEKATLSESGKSYTLASTKGNTKLTAQGFEDVRIGFNCYIPKDRFDELKRIKEIEEAGGTITTGLPADKKDKVIAEQEAKIAQLEASQAETNAKLDKLLALLGNK